MLGHLKYLLVLTISPHYTRHYTLDTRHKTLDSPDSPLSVFQTKCARPRRRTTADTLSI